MNTHDQAKSNARWTRSTRAIPTRVGFDVFLVGTKNGDGFLVSDCDLGVVRDLSWSVCSEGYASSWKFGKQLRAHNLILGRKEGCVADHINGNRLDNRRCNLRHSTYQENARNTRPRGQISRFRGVSWHKRSSKWQVGIRVNGRAKWIGLFHNELDAAIAYDDAVKELYGEFARLNFPPTDLALIPQSLG